MRDDKRILDVLTCLGSVSDIIMVPKERLMTYMVFMHGSGIPSPVRRRVAAPSDEMTSLAGKTLRDPKSSPLARKLAASVLALDPREGPHNDNVKE